MGYDPYDYYDLGDFNQKGRIKTWFGNQAELIALINAAHTANMQVYADLVIDHNNGGDAQELNPIDGQTRWTKFNPGSGKFPRDWTCFHPSPYETFDDDDLRRHAGPVPSQSAGVRGAHQPGAVDDRDHRLRRLPLRFRQGLRAVDGEVDRRAALSEQVGSTAFIPSASANAGTTSAPSTTGSTSINTFMDNPVSAFDFPLHYRLKDALRHLWLQPDDAGPAGHRRAGLAVCTRSPSSTTTTPFAIPATPSTTTSCWRTASSSPTKAIPASSGWTGTTSGWRQTGTPNGIAALVAAHEHFAGGTTQVLFAGDNLYIMQRTGATPSRAGLCAQQSWATAWNGATVQTQWHGVRFEPVAYGGHDTSRPGHEEDLSRRARRLLGRPARMGGLCAGLVSRQSPLASKASYPAVSAKGGEVQWLDICLRN